MENNIYENNQGNEREYDPDDRYSRISDMYDDIEESVQADYAADVAADSMRKKRAHMISGLAVGLCVAIAALGIATPIILKNSGKAVLGSALSNLSKDIQSAQVLSPEDKEDVLNSLYYGDATTTYSMNVSGIPNVPVTLGIDGNLGRSFDSKRMSAQNSVSIMNAHVADLNIYAEDSEIYVSIPDIFDETFKLETEGFAQKFNNSYIAQLAGISIPDTVELRPFGDGIKHNIELTDCKSLNDSCKMSIAAVGKDAKVTKEKGNISYVLADSSQVKVRSYHVTLSQTSVNELWEDYVEAMYQAGLFDTISTTGNKLNQGINDFQPGQSIVPELGTSEPNEMVEKLKSVEIQSDVLLNVYVDSSNQIRYITDDAPIMIDGYAVEMAFSFEGPDSCVENQMHAINVSKGDTEGDEVAGSAMEAFDGETYMLTTGVEADGKKTINASMQGDLNMSLEIIESMTYKDKVFSADFDKIAFYYNNANVGQMSGTFEVLVDQANITDYSNGKVIDLLNMGLMDMLTIAGELSGKYGDLSGLLGGLGL